jgi:hypothetical protein
MNKRLFDRGELERLAPYLQPDPASGPPPEPATIELRDFDPAGQARAAAHLLRDGMAPTEVLARCPGVADALARMRLDGPGLYPGSTWQEMGQRLGPLRWEWPRRIPAGMLTLLVAEQGKGKSCLCLRLAACYLRGDPWPDGLPYSGELGAVLWCEAEASQGLNYARATGWGLPVERIISPLSDPLDEVLLQDTDHRAAIETWAHRPEVRLVIVDSLSGANTARENDAGMLHVTKWLASLAVDAGKPIILTHHLRKRGLLDTGDRVTLDRIRGSGAITQAARSVLAIDAPDPAHEHDLRLSSVKNNLVGAPNAGPALGMVINAQGVTFNSDAPEPPREETAQDKAADLLLALLAKGPKRSTDLRGEIEAAGISWDAANRAKAQLHIVAHRQTSMTGGKQAAWYWSLPGAENV